MNTKAKVNISEEEFVRRFFEIFEPKVIKSENSKRFFKIASQCEGFLHAFKEISNFITSEKVKVPSKFDFGLQDSRKKLSVREPSETMKNSGTYKFFRSANYTKEIMRKKSENNILDVGIGYNSAYIPKMNGERHIRNMQ